MKQDFIRANPMIIQALRENQNKKADALMAAAENMNFPFSLSFERKMEKLIRAQRKPYYSLVSTRARKTVLALAAVLILLATLVFSVSALRVPFLKFIVETYEKFSSMIFVQSETDAPLPTTIERIYEPTYIPEGYALDKESTIFIDTLRTLRYIRENDRIEFQQFVLEATKEAMNTEGVPTEEVPVNDTFGFYYSNIERQTLAWDNGLYGFSLAGNLEKDVLLIIARSLKEK